jgi:hypothetical protein
MAHHDSNFRSIVLRNIRLEHQFERRQHDFKANMQVQPDVAQYRVDPVITGEYVPPNADNCREMECFDLAAWQSLTDPYPCS